MGIYIYRERESICFSGLLAGERSVTRALSGLVTMSANGLNPLRVLREEKFLHWRAVA